MYDYHTHTAFSDDCDIAMEEMILQAIQCGVKELAITDHYDPGYEDPEFPFCLDFDRYYESLLEMSQKYEDAISIIKGMEIGIMDSELEECSRAVTPVSYTHLDVYKRQALQHRHHSHNLQSLDFKP